MIRSTFHWFKHLIYAVLILATLGGLAEVGLRVYDSATGGRIAQRPQQDRGPVCKSWFVYQSLKPGRAFAIRNPDHNEERVTVSINSHGFRGGEIKVPKVPGTFRIVCLGDERTLSPQLIEEQTFCRLLQQQLQSLSTAPVEVINAGVPDYCPLLSCLQMRHQILPLQANLVIENFDMSDIADDYLLRQRTVLDDAGAPQCCAHPDLEVAQTATYSNPTEFFLLPKWGRQQVKRLWAEKVLGEQQKSISTSDGKYLWLEDRPPDWSIYTQQALAPLGNLQELLAAQAAMQPGTQPAPLIVCMAPAPWQVSGTASSGARQKAGVPAGASYASNQPFELVRNYCTSKRIPCCDLSNSFRKHAQPDTLYLQNAAAYSRDGQILYARQLAQFLVENVSGPWGQRAPATPSGEPATVGSQLLPDLPDRFPHAANRQ